MVEMACSGCQLLRPKFFGATAINPVVETSKLHMTTMPVHVYTKGSRRLSNESAVWCEWGGRGGPSTMNHPGPIVALSPFSTRSSIHSPVQIHAKKMSTICADAKVVTLLNFCTCAGVRVVECVWLIQTIFLKRKNCYTNIHVRVFALHYTHILSKRRAIHIPRHIYREDVLEDETHNKSHSSVLNSH